VGGGGGGGGGPRAKARLWRDSGGASDRSSGWRGCIAGVNYKGLLAANSGRGLGLFYRRSGARGRRLGLQGWVWSGVSGISRQYNTAIQYFGRGLEGPSQRGQLRSNSKIDGTCEFQRPH